MNYINILADFFWVKKNLSIAGHSIFLWIDSVIYWLASVMYDLFLKISGVRLFDNEFLGVFANRIYVFMGVIMLFFLAYSLLKAIIDPEQLSKGDKSVAKMVPNIVISLVIVGFLPTIFDYMYDLQTFILQKNIIGTLIFGNDTQTDNITDFGNYLSVTVLDGFITTESDASAETINNWETIKSDMYYYGKWTDYYKVVSVATPIYNGEMTYKIVMSTLCGGYLLFLLLTFCLDLGLRAVKLAFLQLIAPIPVIMRALPNGKKSFDSWIKSTATAYFEVFIRVLIMYMVALFAHQIFDLYKRGALGSDIIVAIVIVMGIFMFAKDAPKLITEVLGLPAGNLKMGFNDFKEKLKTGAAPLAGAAGVVGATAFGGALGLARNTFKGLDRVKKGELSAGQAFRSSIAGLASGMLHGGKGALKSKNLKEFKSNFNESADQVSENREKRYNYYATHGKNLAGVIGGRASDIRDDFNQYVGIDESPENMLKQIAYIKDLKAQESKIKEEAKGLLAKYGDNTAILEKGSKDADGKFTGDIGFKGDNQDITKALYGAYLNSGINNFKALKQAIEDEEKAGLNIEKFRRSDGTFNSGAYEEEKMQFSINMANKKSMLAQVEKKTLDRIQNNAYNISEIGLDANTEKDILQMRSAYEVSESILKEQGTEISIKNNTDAWKNLSDQLDNERKREHEITAKAEAAKRKQEARKKDS